MTTEMEKTWADFDGAIESLRNSPAADESHEMHEIWQQQLAVAESRKARMEAAASKYGIEQTPPDWLNQFETREIAYFQWLLSKIH